MRLDAATQTRDSQRGFNGTAGGFCNGRKEWLETLGRGLDSQVRQIDSISFGETQRKDHIHVR